LSESADHILSEFEKYGLAVNRQEFEVEGSDGTFRNIEDIIRNGDRPELLIVSHYDTVCDCPGADDNGSAIAVMPEAARILGNEKCVLNIRFMPYLT
jgi:Zn-dependent M28 family amino/carboxypeptidase